MWKWICKCYFICVLFLFLAVTETCTFKRDSIYYQKKQSPYNFSYEVSDEEQDLFFSHHETLEDQTVHGQYKVLLPDGRLQTVTYTAGEDGYHAKVTYTLQENRKKHSYRPAKKNIRVKSKLKPRNLKTYEMNRYDEENEKFLPHYHYEMNTNVRRKSIGTNERTEHDSSGPIYFSPSLPFKNSLKLTANDISSYSSISSENPDIPARLSVKREIPHDLGDRLEIIDDSHESFEKEEFIPLPVTIHKLMDMHKSPILKRISMLGMFPHSLMSSDA